MAKVYRDYAHIDKRRLFYALIGGTWLWSKEAQMCICGRPVERVHGG